MREVILDLAPLAIVLDLYSKLRIVSYLSTDKMRDAHFLFACTARQFHILDEIG